MSGPRYSLEEAQALLPEAQRQLAVARSLVAELQGLLDELQAGLVGGTAADRVGTLEHDVDEAFGWFERRGVQVKSLAPALLDFPARGIRAGEAVDVLLCWRDDEETIAYYHLPDVGYRGREPVALLERV